MEPLFSVSYDRKKKRRTVQNGPPFSVNRSDKNRTCGLLNPIQALYQTEPHPEAHVTV